MTRFATAASFFATEPDEEVGIEELDDSGRLQLLLDEEVDAVVISPRGNGDVLRLLACTPGVEAVKLRDRLTENQRIFLVDRDELAEATREGAGRSTPRCPSP